MMLSLVSCRHSLTPNAYMQWFKTSEDNLSVGATDDYIYEVRYMSPEVESLLEFGADKDSLDKYKTEFQKFSNFNLKIFAKEKGEDILKYKLSNEGEYYERLQYFISYFNNDVKAVGKNNDTTACAFHHYERTYKITPFATISMSFEGSIKDIDKIVVKLPFDNQKVAIKIKKISYPQLKF